MCVTTKKELQNGQGYRKAAGISPAEIPGRPLTSSVWETAPAAVASVCLVVIVRVFDPSPVPSTQTDGGREVLTKTLQNSSLQFLISFGTKHPISTEKLKVTSTRAAQTAVGLLVLLFFFPESLSLHCVWKPIIPEPN